MSPRTFASVAAADLGLRFGYYPLRWLGGELEAGLMPTRTDPDASALLYTRCAATSSVNCRSGAWPRSS